MPITKFPPDLKIPQLLPCHLCQSKILPDKATLGPVTATGEQLYACATHLQQASWQYLMSWIEIIILYRSSSMGSIHARPLC